MKPLAQRFGTCVASAIAAIWAPVLVTTAQAGSNVWTSHGPFALHVFALAIDPITTSTLYVGMYDSGVFKSTDAGRTWGSVGAGLVGYANTLAIDPITPATVYAATNAYGGVFKSTNAGTTWTAVNRGLNTCLLTALAIDPATPSVLYVAAQYHDDSSCGGVFKSMDAGVTWARADAGLPPPTSVPALAIDPVMPRTLYAGTGGGFPAIDGHGVFKSTDAGVTWAAANTGLPPSTCVSAVAIDPLVPGTLYAATGGPWCGVGNGIFKSTDAGSTWITTTLTNARVSAVAIDPVTPSTLYASTYGDGVFKSTNAGTTWGAVSAGLTNTLVAALAIDPLIPISLYAGTSTGVFSIQQVAGCIGDCNSDGAVTVDELVAGVNIAKDTLPLGECPSFDVGDDGRVTIEEIIAGVDNALSGCRTEGPTELLVGTLFVTDSIANKVRTIDAATGAILASADTGEHPVGVEKANGKVYVANEASGTISVFDSATLSPLTVIPACDMPHHTAVSPDGSRVYAACVGTNKVAVVDAETDALVGLLTSGAPGAMTHQPWPTKDGERLWVANFGTNDITEIDLQTGAILRVFPLGARPIEVVVPADAKTAYVSVPEESKMKVFNLETNELVAEPTMLAPENLMLSSDGKTILASWSGTHNPTAVSIFDTERLTSVGVTLPRGLASHTDLTPHAKFGFVSLAGRPQGIVVVDIEAAAVHAFYPIPGSTLIHAVRYAPGPP